MIDRKPNLPDIPYAHQSALLKPHPIKLASAAWCALALSLLLLVGYLALLLL